MLHKPKENIIQVLARKKVISDKKHSCPEHFWKLDQLSIVKCKKRGVIPSGSDFVPFRLWPVQLQNVVYSTKLLPRINGVYLRQYNVC